ncbi:MAG: uncharacterized protein QOD72_1806 [Acidimicrobiaceae bacterium]|jgi:uncharacterized protein YlxP (DUF503 family)|nr:uncharacterized protein [Acidimicrobiaceae bacterium]
MFVLTVEADLHINESRSLKAKRQVIRPIVEGARHRFGVSAAEVGYQDQWQRALLGFAVVAGTASHAEEVIDAVDRFVWSRPDVEILSMDRKWLE